MLKTAFFKTFVSVLKSQTFITIASMQWFFKRHIQEGFLIEFIKKAKENPA